MRLSSGDKLGHYEILSLLGKGGMGEVYRGRDTRLKRDVAIRDGKTVERDVELLDYLTGALVDSKWSCGAGSGGG